MTRGKRSVNITCAVVKKLNYPLILGSDIVDKLNQELMDESFVANENGDDDVGDDDDDDDVDDDDDDVHENEVTNDKGDKDQSENDNMSDPRKASTKT